MNISHATFSPCSVYRYALFRDLGMQGPKLTAVMLNPSTADAKKDDPTIRRLTGFAKSWGMGSLLVLNLFAIRATDPRDMMAAADPVGPDNDEAIRHALQSAKDEDRAVLAAWGAHGSHRARDFHVMQKLVDGVRWECLGTTHQGHPKHPLYVPSITSARPYIR
jgi:hypothetical protein